MLLSYNTAFPISFIMNVTIALWLPLSAKDYRLVYIVFSSNRPIDDVCLFIIGSAVMPSGVNYSLT